MCCYREFKLDRGSVISLFHSRVSIIINYSLHGMLQRVQVVIEGQYYQVFLYVMLQRVTEELDRVSVLSFF